MAGAAKVQAISAVESLSVALRRFQEEAGTALEELQLQVHRAVDWIENDLKRYWKEAERRAWQQISEARVQLEQARTSRRMSEFEPACREEKKILERAEQRLRTAQEKLERLRHWAYVVDRAVLEFRSGTRPLGLWLEADLPRGLAALRQMTAALEAYVALQAPDLSPSPGAAVSAAAAGPAEVASEHAPPPEEKATEPTSDDATIEQSEEAAEMAQRANPAAEP